MAGYTVAYSSVVGTHVRLGSTSVSHGFPIEQRKARMEYDFKIMKYLISNSMSTEANIYNASLFVQLRQMYYLDSMFAKKMYLNIYPSDAQPIFGPGSSALYRQIFRWAGFEVAQRAASLARSLRQA